MELFLVTREADDNEGHTACIYALAVLTIINISTSLF
jgi:hypothetical protein